MNAFTPSPTLLSILPPAGRATLARFQVWSVEDPDDPWFSVAYDGLVAHFAEDGQIEPRAALARLLTPFEHAGVRAVHAMMVATDAEGALVAVFARYVTWEPATGVLTGLDGMGFVAEPFRRHGMAAISMPVLIDHGRVRLGAPEHAIPTALDVGDFGLVRADDPVSIGRAIVWGRSGCAVVPPDVFPFTLVGMAGKDGDVAPPVPLLAALRTPDGRPGQPASVSKAQLRALARHLEAAHAWAGEGSALAEETARLQAAIDAAPDDPIVLIPLPTSPEDGEALARLFALVHPVAG